MTDQMRRAINSYQTKLLELQRSQDVALFCSIFDIDYEKAQMGLDAELKKLLEVEKEMVAND